MASERAIWGIHMEWDDGHASPETRDVAIGWNALGDLNALASTREAFKTALAKAYPTEKPGAVPVMAGVLYRFAKEMAVGDVIVYPSKADRLVNVGLIAGDYTFLPSVSSDYPNRRPVNWRVHRPRAEFSQPALNEIGSAITLFRISNSAEEFVAALDGKPFDVAGVDAATAEETSNQAQENIKDFIIKRLKNDLNPKQFEQFVAALLECMGYHTRVTRFHGDGGVDIIAHEDELGFKPPIIKVQCKQTLSAIGGPQVQQLLGAIHEDEHALFVALGDYSADADRIERGKSKLRLIGGDDLVKLILHNYERLEPRFKALLPLKRSYTPIPTLDTLT